MFSQNEIDLTFGIAEGNFQQVWPWRKEPYRLWSLFDMLRLLHVGNLSAFMINFERVCTYVYMLDDPPPAEAQNRQQLLNNNLDKFREALQGILDVCERGEVPLSYTVRRQLERFRQRLDQTASQILDHASLIVYATEIRQMLVDEISQHLFICIPAEDRELIEQIELPFGESVARIFEKANRDIQASGRCLAFGEWTACVFHSMRVLEHGLHELASRVGLPPESMALENWKNVIDQIEARIKAIEKDPKSAAKSAKLKTYSSSAIQFRYFKDAWRNHVSHGRDTYDEREARLILNHVKEFMQSLASEVDHEGKVEH
jgi:hypothetical protein